MRIGKDTLTQLIFKLALNRAGILIFTQLSALYGPRHSSPANSRPDAGPLAEFHIDNYREYLT